MHIIIKWLLCSVALVFVGAVMPGIKIRSFVSAMIAVVLISVINMFLGPILQFLALPLTILTLGIFALVVNAFLFWLAGALLKGFDVKSGWNAFFGSLLYSILIAFIN